MDENQWVIPSKISAEEVLFMYEAVYELCAMINGYFENSVDADDIVQVAAICEQKMDEISASSCVDKMQFFRH